MAEYFVSAAGNDSNSGRFSAPWKTLDRVNTAIAAGGEAEDLNNRIRFRRGDTFYGKIRTRNGLQFYPDQRGWLKFGAYGPGAAPVISGYKIFNISGGWVAHDANTWKVDHAAANVGTTFTGNAVASETTNQIGFIKVDGVIFGRKKYALADLAQQWDFYTTGTTLYVRSTARPTTLASDIRGAPDLIGASLYSCVEVSNLIFEGYASHGISTIGSERVKVRNCTIREIGGGDGGVDNRRYGNGFQAYTNTKDMLFEYNTVHDVYDAAWTIQGGVAGVPGTDYFTNITWRRNLTYRCAQAEEYWYEGVGPGFQNCLSEYNTYLFSGYGFGGDTRPDQNQRVGQQSYAWGAVPPTGYTATDLVIRRNVYYDCRVAFAYNAYPPLGQESDYNVILLRPNTKMQFQASQTIENAAAWAASVGREQHSQFVVLPASNDLAISNADVTAALATLDNRVRVGQVTAIHGPWV
jgi:hypothetical protein